MEGQLEGSLPSPRCVEMDFSHQEAFDGAPMQFIQVWPLNLMNTCIALAQNKRTGHGEVIWIGRPETNDAGDDVKLGRVKCCDVSLWALNRNNFSKEDMDDFVVPPFLVGDASLPLFCGDATATTAVLVASCYAVPCAAIVIRHQHVLIFDRITNTTTAFGKGDEGRMGKKRKIGEEAHHWRQMVTTEMTLPSVIPVTAACFVLDEFLLLAH